MKFTQQDLYDLLVALDAAPAVGFATKMRHLQLREMLEKAIASAQHPAPSIPKPTPQPEAGDNGRAS